MVVLALQLVAQLPLGDMDAAALHPQQDLTFRRIRSGRRAGVDCRGAHDACPPAAGLRAGSPGLPRSMPCARKDTPERPSISQYSTVSARRRTVSPTVA